MPGDTNKTVVLHRDQRLRQVYIDVPSVLINAPTSKHYHEAQETNVNSTIIVNFRKAVQKWKNTPFLAFRSGLSCTLSTPIPKYQTITFCEADQMVNRLAAAFKYIGLEYQKKLGLFGHTSPLLLMTDLAIAALGGISVSIPPFLSFENIIYAINHSGVRVLLTQANLVPTILGISDKCPFLRLILIFDKALNDLELLPLAVKVYTEVNGYSHLLHGTVDEDEASLSENVIDRAYLTDIADKSSVAIDALSQSIKDYENDQKALKSNTLVGAVRGLYDDADDGDSDSQKSMVVAAHFNNVNPLNPTTLGISEDKLTDAMTKQLIFRAQFNDVQSRFTTPLTAIKIAHLSQGKRYGQTLSKELYDLLSNLRNKEHSLESAKDCINASLYLGYLENLNVIQLDQLLDLTKKDAYDASHDYPVDTKDIWSISYSEVGYTSKYSSIDYLFNTCNRNLWSPVNALNTNTSRSKPLKKFDYFSHLISNHPIKANVYSHNCFLSAINSHFYHHFPYNKATFSNTHSSYYCHLPYSLLFERMMEHGAISRGYRLVFHAGEFRYLFSDMLLGKPTIFAASPRFYKKLHQYLVEFITKISANKKKLFEKTYNTRLAKFHTMYAAMEKAHSLVYMLDTIEYFEKKFQDIHIKNVEAIMQTSDDDAPSYQRLLSTISSTNKIFTDGSGTFSAGKGRHKRIHSYSAANQYIHTMSSIPVSIESKHILDELGVDSMLKSHVPDDNNLSDITEPWIYSKNPRTKSLYTFKIAAEDASMGDSSQTKAWHSRMRKTDSKDFSLSVAQGDTRPSYGQTEEERKFDKYMQTIINKVSAPLSASVKEFVPPDDILKTVQSKSKIFSQIAPLLPKNVIQYTENSDSNSHSEISTSSTAVNNKSILSTIPVKGMSPIDTIKVELSPFKARYHLINQDRQPPAKSNNKSNSSFIGGTESSHSEASIPRSMGCSSKHESEQYNPTEVFCTVTSTSHSKSRTAERPSSAGPQLMQVRKRTRSTHRETLVAMQASNNESVAKTDVPDEREAKPTFSKQQKELLKLQKQQQKNLNKVVKDKTVVTKELNKLHFEDNLKSVLKSTNQESPVIQRVQDLFGGSLEFIISNSVIDNVDTWEFLRVILGCHGCQMIGYSELSGGGLYNEIHDTALNWSLGRSGVGVKCKIVDLSEGWFPDILTRLVLDSITPSLHISNKKLYIQRYNKLQEMIANAMPRFIDTQLGELCLTGSMLSMGYYSGDPLYQYAKNFKQTIIGASVSSIQISTSSPALSTLAFDSAHSDAYNKTTELHNTNFEQYLHAVPSTGRMILQEELDQTWQHSSMDSISVDSTQSHKNPDMNITLLDAKMRLLKQAERRKALIIAKKNATALGLPAASIKHPTSLEIDSLESAPYTVGAITGQSVSQSVTGVPLVNLQSPVASSTTSQTSSARRTSTSSANTSIAADIASLQTFVPTLMTPATTNPFSAPLNRNQTEYTSCTSLSLGNYKAAIKDTESLKPSAAIRPSLTPNEITSTPRSGMSSEVHSISMQPATESFKGLDEGCSSVNLISPNSLLYQQSGSHCRDTGGTDDNYIDYANLKTLVPHEILTKPLSECLIDPTDEDDYYHTGDMVEFEQISGRIIYRGTIRDYLDKNLYSVIEKFLIEEGLVLSEQTSNTILGVSPLLLPADQMEIYSRPGKVPLEMWSKGKAIALRMRHQLCSNLNLTFKLSASHYLNIGQIEELIMLEIPYVIDVLLYTFDGASRPMAFLYIRGPVLLEAMKQGGIVLKAIENGDTDFVTDKFTNSRTVIYATLAKLHGEQKEKLMNFLKGSTKGAPLQKYVMRTGQCAFLSTIDNSRIITYIRSDIRMMLRDRNLSKYFAPMTIIYVTNSDLLLTEQQLRTVTGRRNRELFLKKFSGDIARYKQDEGVPELILH